MSNYVDIIGYSPEMLQHTCYYFRLGSDCIINDQFFRINETTPLTIPPSGYAIIKSYEIFVMSEKVLGIFGQVSTITLAGLSVNNSPFIDPLFKGQLEIGITNLLNKPVNISYQQKIGKVSFFDVSDTYPISIEDDLLIKSTFERRKPDYDDHPVPGWDTFKR